MPKENKKRLGGVRLPADLYDFIHEEAKKPGQSITGVVEYFLTFAAKAHGFQPDDPNQPFGSFTANIVEQLARKLKEEGFVVSERKGKR